MKQLVQDLKKGESEYIELDEVSSYDLNSYAKDLQAILINPPWSNKAPKFDFNKFSKSYPMVMLLILQ